MSAILASIADAERLATRDNTHGEEFETRARATAARAEHAEIVEALKHYGEHRAHCDLGMRPQSECTCGLDTLLSRVGGGA